MAKNTNTTLPYWQGGVFYQIYPRSFCDSNDDGIGDLNGITQNLDHVASLGVDGIWISPFFKSPMKDFGYDVSDYRDIDPIFGTLDDFKTMLTRAHELDLKVIIDLVLSHTSDQHPWFQNALEGGDKKGWYVWADGKNGQPPNNWVSLFGGSAWEWSEEHQQYYLHNFLKEQPDLNYHNPEVQTEALDIAKFWLDIGVDGFRLDVINFCTHDQELRNNPPHPNPEHNATQFEGDDPYSDQLHLYDKSRPENLEFIKKLRALCDRYDGVFTIGEIGDDSPYDRAAEYTDGNALLHTTYNPQLMSGTQKALTPALIREPFEEFARAVLKQRKSVKAGCDLARRKTRRVEKPTQATQQRNHSATCEDGGWPSWAFSNHDVVRAASRWHPDPSGHAHDPELSRTLMALLVTLRGTAFIYQGEELGLPETKLAFDDLQDPWGKHLWPEWQGRDGCRTPMPWNNEKNLGFSTSKPWLPVNDAYKALTVEAQNNDPHSTLNFVRDVLTWRNAYPVFQDGEIIFHDTDNENFLAFERQNKTHAALCLFNLSNTEHPLQEFALTQLYPDMIETQAIKPYGFLILEND